MTTKPKSRSAVTRAVNRGQIEDRLHLVPATAATCLKLARAERIYFAGRAITELAARCILAETRRHRATHMRGRSRRGADYRWKWRPGGPGRRPEIGFGQYAGRLTATTDEGKHPKPALPAQPGGREE